MSEQNILLKEKENREIELSDFSSLNIEVERDSNLVLKLANFKENKDIKIRAKIKRNGTLAVIFADFAKSDIAFKSVVDLVEEGANCTWHLATLSSQSNNKIFDVNPS